MRGCCVEGKSSAESGRFPRRPERGNQLGGCRAARGRIADRDPRSASSSASPSANPVGPNGRGRWMTNAHRDLAAPELWTRSLERSRRRRALLPKARRENNRRKHVSAALATAVVAGPGAPLAAAQMSGNVSAAVAAESPANRAIEIREGGLPLRVGSQGDLV